MNCLSALGLVLVCMSGRKCCFFTLERLLIICCIVGIIALTIADPYRSAGICGEDPFAAWEDPSYKEKESVLRKRHSDSTLLLSYDLIITGVHILAPIRSCTSCLVPSTAVAMYSAFTVAYGGPENNFTFKKSTAFLALLGLMAWM